VKKFLMLSALALGISSVGSASIIVTFDSTVAGTWTWNVDVETASEVRTGDFFTIYDLQGFDGSSAHGEPGGWTWSAQLIGITPNLVNPFDDPGAFNVTWTYSGTTVVGPSDLGSFSIFSTAGGSRVDAYSASGHAPSDIGDPGSQQNVGLTLVPGDAVPEPSSVILFGAGLAALVVGARRRSRA